ncbi:MAG: DUF4440 domain-containing protein [Planctomycetota bacterium]|nr:DUF4440 domain-containing protein [Planctomycetota bacterium]
MIALRRIAAGAALAAAGALAVAQEDSAGGGSGLRGGTTRAEVYERRPLRGFDVRVHPGLIGEGDHAAVGARALDALERDLGDLLDQVPASAATRLRTVPLYLGVSDPVAPCACYHPSAAWLADNGYDPAKAKSVEISNAATFLAWRRAQPSMVLHELAHAFHDLELQGAAGRIAAAMVAARDRGNYRSVLRASGARDSHYAMTNAMEYFAETTEALLGVNDFYPFVRAELLNHDPEGARLVAELWGAPELAPVVDEEDAGGASMDELVRAEIAELHDRFARWFNDRDEAAIAGIEGALAPGFVMVTPSGRLQERDELMLALRASGGRRPIELATRVLRVEALGAGRSMAVYEETQREKGQTRIIVSTALFEQASGSPGGVRWLHVHETFGAR